MADLDAKTLAETVRWVSGGLPSRPVVPIMSCITLHGDGTALRVGAWDYELQATATIPCDGEITVAVSGRTLADVTDRLRGRASLTIDGNRLVVTDGRRTYKLAVAALDGYPQVPSAPPQIGKADGLAEAFTCAALAASRDMTLGVLTGVNLIADGDALTVRATDRYRLADVRIPWDGEPFQALVLAGRVQQAVKAWEGVLTVGCDGNRLSVSNGSREVTIATFGGEPPKLQGILDYFDHAELATLTADREELLEAVRSAGVIAADKTPIRVRPADGGITLTGLGGDTGDGTVPCDAVIEGDWPAVVAYNPSYFADGLGVFDSDTVRIHLGDRRKSVLITAVDGSGEDVPGHRHILMPVSTPGEDS